MSGLLEILSLIFIIVVGLANLFSFSLIYITPTLMEQLVKNSFLANLLGGLIYLLSFGLGVYLVIQVATLVPPPTRQTENIQAALILLVLLATQWFVFYILRLITRKKEAAY